MARVFHIGLGDGGYTLAGVTEIAPEPKTGLSAQFGGTGFDESAKRAAVYDMAMTNFPSPVPEMKI